MSSTKELNFCHKLCFSHPYNFTTECSRPFIFQTMNHIRPNNLSNNPNIKGLHLMVAKIYGL